MTVAEEPFRTEDIEENAWTTELTAVTWHFGSRIFSGCDLMARICCFCGSRMGTNPIHGVAAREVARQLAVREHTLVYGGGSTGIMGVLADTLLRSVSPVIGVIPEHLARPELMHQGVADMRVTQDMHERKALMHELAEAYIVLPGGYGTLEELFEAVTWAQLDLHRTPIALLNSGDLYSGLLTTLEKMTEQDFMSPGCRSLLNSASTVESLMDWLDKIFPENAPTVTGRFAILTHDHPTPHLDLLLESGDSAMTWRLPEMSVPGQSLTAERIQDHRLHYLDYDGPVSGNRGSVSRLLSGRYRSRKDRTPSGESPHQSWTILLNDVSLHEPADTSFASAVAAEKIGGTLAATLRVTSAGESDWLFY